MKTSEGHVELLRETGLAAAVTLAAPWQYYNLRLAGMLADRVGEYLSFQRIRTDRPGNLSRSCTLEDSSGDDSYTAAAEVCATGDSGLNVYLFRHPDDETPFKVYQVPHPGDGKWHTLKKSFHAPATIQCVKLMVVVRSDSAPLHVRTLSLQRLETTRRTGESLAHLHISEAYHEAVVRLVDGHPAAGDSDFRSRLYRSLAHSNRKGIRTVESILRRLRPAGFSLAGGRFLDLGCGTGGSLVGAKVHGAAECEGWEVNEEKLALARLNTTSLYGDEPDITIQSNSIDGTGSTCPDFRPFQLVFCEEVLEHVKDVPAAIATLARCLDNERGIAYVTIPAGYAFESVLADPHLKLFGITLLDRFEAQPFATALKHHTHYRDMMGGYLWYSEYCQRFAGAGLDCIPVHAEISGKKAIADAGKQLDAIRGQRAMFRETWSGTIGESDLALLESRLDGYIDRATVALAEAAARKATEAVRLRFIQQYGVPHLEFLLAPAGSALLKDINSC